MTCRHMSHPVNRPTEIEATNRIYKPANLHSNSQRSRQIDHHELKLYPMTKPKTPAVRAKKTERLSPAARLCALECLVRDLHFAAFRGKRTVVGRKGGTRNRSASRVTQAAKGEASEAQVTALVISNLAGAQIANNASPGTDLVERFQQVDAEDHAQPGRRIRIDDFLEFLDSDLEDFGLDVNIGPGTLLSGRLPTPAYIAKRILGIV